MGEMTLREHQLIDSEIFRRFPANLAFKQANPDYPIPPIAFMCDAHGSWDYEGYRRSGIKGAAMITKLVRDYAGKTTGLKIYEWGCGSGRLIRHLREQLGPDNQYFASDYNKPCIAWCAADLKGIEFFPNDLMPPLPNMADGSMDVVYCRSVFTHLTRANGLAWMAELRRITKPGGLISFSTASDRKLHETLEGKFPEAAAAYKRGEVAELVHDDEGRRGYASFHPPSFVEGEMLKGLTLIEHSVTNQDQWVARR